MHDRALKKLEDHCFVLFYFWRCGADAMVHDADGAALNCEKILDINMYSRHYSKEFN